MARILFVTGRFAEPALRQVVPALAEQLDVAYEIAVLPITVAALMHVEWVQRKLTVPEGIDRVILPGWCQGDLSILANQWHVPFERGPKDVFDLPEYLGRPNAEPPRLDDYSIEILAEINHAPRLSLDELLWQAEVLRSAGANVIDLGCIPGDSWAGIGAATRRLVAAGHHISVDSFVEQEVTDAVANGAELVLSTNSSNLAWAANVPAEFVVIPDSPPDAASLDAIVAAMTAAGRKVRLDPILEPVGFGFATSLARYFDVRQRHPAAALLMGIGNVTELSEVDSAGVNFTLAAICEELRIGSVLTTQVINWCRSAVAEFDAARRLVRYSLSQRRLPKHLDGRLLLLRDPKLHELGDDGLRQLAARITDPNFRIFAERGEVHLLNRDGYWHGNDPYEVFDRMIAAVGSLSSEHTFYLGMELMKARTALTLGKQYVQDEALRWGFLTIDETSAVARRHREATAGKSSEMI
ncbi:MAG TPA: DUF6513 domain-containing protein [Planctomycetaceae bacterium]|nr:DUF6513 domain-containing protein [Planctomycetaceae bacterium]